jgi:hypothetical protein
VFLAVAGAGVLAPGVLAPVCWGRRAGAGTADVRPVRPAGQAGSAGFAAGASRFDGTSIRLQPVRWSIEPVAGDPEVTG